ncbi:hypothetical protein D6745_04955 [Candidatus Woesearchaeota archaeon]|nr:MAG: hypothetical protein D6745_04955 [Candidatus Woesearchaeota archaeon]
MDYDLELGKVVAHINKIKAKNVLVQLPDGLKPHAKKIIDAIRSKTSSEAFIWLGDCFGACDIPLGLQSLKIDLVVQFGHNAFVKEAGW